MPLHGLLEKHAFGPEEIQAMVFAFESICQERRLRPVRDDGAREFIAQRVIEYCQRGIRDPGKLRDVVASAIKL